MGRARQSRPEGRRGDARQGVPVLAGAPQGSVGRHRPRRLRQHRLRLRYPRGESCGRCGRAADRRPAHRQVVSLVHPQHGLPGSVHRNAHRAGPRIYLEYFVRVLHSSQTMKTSQRILIAALALLCALPPAVAQSQSDFIAYVGSFTRGKSKGIYAWRFNPSSGKLTALGLAAETSNPSFLAVHPNRRFLYAVNENGAGTVSAFSIDAATAKLALLNTASTRGNGPCHLAVDHSGKYLFAANYGSGSTAVLPIHDDGSLGEASAFVQHAGSSANKDRQSGPHAHCVTQSPDGRFLLVEDLGLDEVLVYRFDAAKGTLTANDPAFAKLAPGTGPRHLAFSPSGRFAYVVGEMFSNVTAFHYDAARGALDEFQTISMLPADFKGNNSGAEIAVH